MALESRNLNIKPTQRPSDALQTSTKKLKNKSHAKSTGQTRALLSSSSVLPKDSKVNRWVIDLDALSLSFPTGPGAHSVDKSSSQTRIRQNILIIGTPSQADIYALLHSTLLKDSLLLIATHDARPFGYYMTPGSHPSSCPTTRILRLGSPVFPSFNNALSQSSITADSSSAPKDRLAEPVSDGGSDALRLMSLFQRASNVSSSLEWEMSTVTSASDPRIQQFTEHPDTSEFTIPETLGSSDTPKPYQAMDEITSAKKVKRRTFFFASTTPPSTTHAGQRSFPISSADGASATCHGRRPFDAIINYVSSDPSIVDKVLLKQTIMVTTLAVKHLTGFEMPSTLSSSESFNSASVSSSPLEKLKLDMKHVALLSIPLARKFTVRSSSPSRHSKPGDALEEVRVAKPKGRKKSLPDIPPSSGDDWERVDRVERYHGPARLLHVLPTLSELTTCGSVAVSYPVPKPKLVSSIEQFVTAFTNPFRLPASKSTTPSEVTLINAPRMTTSKSTSAIERSGLYSNVEIPDSYTGVPSRLMPDVLVRETNSGPYAREWSEESRCTDFTANVRTLPYIIGPGSLGGMLSIACKPLDGHSRMTGKERSTKAKNFTLSVADLILFGALDGNYESGDKKSWLGGWGADDVVDSLTGNGKTTSNRELLEVRHGQRMLVEKVWRIRRADELHGASKEGLTVRDAKVAKDVTVKGSIRSSSLPGAPQNPSRPDGPSKVPMNRTPSKLARKAAPSIPESSSLLAAWQAISQPKEARVEGRETENVNANERDIQNGVLASVRGRLAVSIRKDKRTTLNNATIYDHLGNTGHGTGRDLQSVSRGNSERDRKSEGMNRERHPHEHDHFVKSEERTRAKGKGAERSSHHERNRDRSRSETRGDNVPDYEERKETRRRRHEAEPGPQDAPAITSVDADRRREDNPSDSEEPKFLAQHRGSARFSRLPAVVNIFPESRSIDSATRVTDESFDIARYYQYDRYESERHRAEDQSVVELDKDKDKDRRNGVRRANGRVKHRERDKSRQEGGQSGGSGRRIRDQGDSHRDRSDKRERMEDMRTLEVQQPDVLDTMGSPLSRSAHAQYRYYGQSRETHREPQLDPERLTPNRGNRSRPRSRESDRNRSESRRRRRSGYEEGGHSLPEVQPHRRPFMPVVDAQDYANALRDGPRGVQRTLCAIVGVPPSVRLVQAP
ncbi:hypothetical protein FA15DRAFT_667314 [Coprinopsis marcescibilis]|uniref:Uncharacterized protein n=1 Tax=Coprinopsis marcescibilis TaxID=230819 RepID=A0A5C3L0X0_COPMA|nr:hypothetical protein FA15DRAFT_667314 [Coprinopsis marcescibilis]